MMNCKQVQDMLVTDYLDKELAEPLRRQIDEHLKTCAQCQAFEQAVKRAGVPLRAGEQVQPSEEVWQRIQERIAREGEAAETAPGMVGILERLREWAHSCLSVRRPAFAVSTVLAVTLMALLLVRAPAQRQTAIREYLTEKSEFMVSLSAPLDNDAVSDIDFGSAIEQFFM